jgi:uncharacterized membrane protein YfcA
LCRSYNYGLISAGAPADQAAHVAVATSLAAILPAALTSSIGHWRAGNTDFAFLREWGPGVAIGVVAAQLAAPHLRGSFMTALFGLFTLMAAVRFAAPGRFRPVFEQPPNGNFRRVAGLGIGLRMNVHKNARLTPHSRAELVRRVLVLRARCPWWWPPPWG